MKKVFIGWSGERSKKVALELRAWIPKVIQRVEPWMSEQDIQPGALWLRELIGQLRETHFGILALTQQNMREAWIHFEAGALANSVEESFVCPYLIDIEKGTDLTGPLTQFQARRADKEGTLALLGGINQTLGESKLAETTLFQTFERWWTDLEKVIATLPKEQVSAQKRSDRELLEEILQKVRIRDRKETDKPYSSWMPLTAHQLAELHIANVLRALRGDNIFNKSLLASDDPALEHVVQVLEKLRKEPRPLEQPPKDEDK
jgi:hypothetical protein